MAIAACLTVGALAFAWFSGRQAFLFLPSLNVPHPTLASAPPILAASGPRLTRRVVLAILDGLRLDASYGRPYLDHLRAVGIDAQAQTHFPSLSRPNYVSLVTGVPPERSGVRTNDYDGVVPLDSLMARAREAGMKVTFIGDSAVGFTRLFAGSLDEGVLAPWPGGLERSAQSALARDDELVILLFDDVDDVGHEKGGASPAYREASRSVDRRLGALLGSLDLAQDTVVVVADHGHVDGGGHGGTEPEVMTVPLILAGRGVVHGATLLGAEVIDVAPTVAALLGLPAPGHALGKTLVAALATSEGERERLIMADGFRRSAFAPLFAALSRDMHLSGWNVRLYRGALVVSLLASLLAFAIWAARWGIVRVDRRVLLTALPAFPLTFYGMVVAFEHFLSPSMVPARDPIAVKLFLYGGVAALVHLCASFTALAGRVVPRERLAAAAGLTLVGLAVALAPAGGAWVMAGQLHEAAIPGPRTLMLPPITYSAVCCYAGSAALTLAVEYLIFLARASDPGRTRGEVRRERVA